MQDKLDLLDKKNPAIPGVIQESEIEQEGSSVFSAGTRDIAKGKDRSEDEKTEAKPTQQNRFLSHERYIGRRAQKG